METIKSPDGAGDGLGIKMSMVDVQVKQVHTAVFLSFPWCKVGELKISKQDDFWLTIFVSVSRTTKGSPQGLSHVVV